MDPLNRRTFIRTFAGGALGGAMLYAFPAESRARYVLAGEQQVEGGDEQFWQIVRDQFPLQHEPVFLNNGTIGPSPYVVIDAVDAEMRDVDRSGRYGGWDDVRAKLATFINAEKEEISITHNVTEGINVVAWGLPLQRGEEVILTNHEHAGNALPWLARARHDGLVIKVLHLEKTAAGTLNRLNDLISPKTRVIAVPHITCTIGQVLPAKEIAALAKRKHIWLMLDAAHTPGMLPLDVKALDCQILATCGHKWMMGPKGTGFLYVRKDMQEVLQPSWTGGGAAAGWDVEKGTIAYAADAHRYDFASQNASLYVGLGVAVDFLHHLGMMNVTRRGLALAGRLRAGLLSLGDRADILTPDEEGGFGSVVGFRLKNVPFDKLQRTLLEQHKIITRMVPENGINCNRVSTHIYNSTAEVDRLVEILRHEAA